MYHLRRPATAGLIAMLLETVLIVMIWIGGAAFLIGSILQLRGRPMSIFSATDPTTSRLDRLGVALTWLGIAFALPAVSAFRRLQRSPGLAARVPLGYVILGAAVLGIGTLVVLR
jgi:hypothetical protein